MHTDTDTNIDTDTDTDTDTGIPRKEEGSRAPTLIQLSKASKTLSSSWHMGKSGLVLIGVSHL